MCAVPSESKGGLRRQGLPQMPSVSGVVDAGWNAVPIEKAVSEPQPQAQQQTVQALILNIAFYHYKKI